MLYLKKPYVFYILREIAVNWIGYKLGVRRLMRRGFLINTPPLTRENAEKVFRDKSMQLKSNDDTLSSIQVVGPYV